MALSGLKCRSARPSEKTTKLSDGEGLQLWVQPTGAKHWRLAYRFGGKQKLLSLGAYPVWTAHFIKQKHGSQTCPSS